MNPFQADVAGDAVVVAGTEAVTAEEAPAAAVGDSRADTEVAAAAMVAVVTPTALVTAEERRLAEDGETAATSGVSQRT